MMQPPSPYMLKPTVKKTKPLFKLGSSQAWLNFYLGYGTQPVVKVTIWHAVRKYFLVRLCKSRLCLERLAMDIVTEASRRTNHKRSRKLSTFCSATPSRFLFTSFSFTFLRHCLAFASILYCRETVYTENTTEFSYYACKACTPPSCTSQEAACF